MSLLRRYISYNIIYATFVVLLMLIGVQTFIRLVNELSYLGQGTYGLGSAVSYVLMMMPGDLYRLFPVAVLMGSLLGLGRLAARNELVVMRASGVSKLKITGVVLQAVLIMMILMTLVGEGVGPRTTHFAIVHKALDISNGQTLHTLHGIWLKDGENFIHIEATGPDGVLLGVSRYEFDHQHNLLLASYAKNGAYQQGHWIFNDVNQTIFLPLKVISNHVDQQEWPLEVKPKLLSYGKLAPDQESIIDLYRVLRYRWADHVQSSQLEFAFWQRLFQPITTIIMMCLALVFIFGPLRSVSIGLRIIAGVIVGFGFYTLNEFLGPFSMVYQVSPFISASLPTLIFGILAGILLWRSRYVG